MTPITFAHRGARAERPENTIPAFSRALELGARGLESDARLTADGEVVLVHDPVIREGLRRRRVDRARASELERFGVPRLAELYAEVGSAYELSIDLKDDLVAEPLLRVAGEAGAVERLWICSPRVSRLHEVRDLGTRARLVHSTKRSALGPSVERYAEQLASTGIDVCNLRHTEWTAGLVGLFHRFGVQAFAWDVQEVRHVRAMLDMGLDGLYSDHVDRLVACVAEWTDT